MQPASQGVLFVSCCNLLHAMTVSCVYGVWRSTSEYRVKSQGFAGLGGHVINEVIGVLYSEIYIPHPSLPY